MAVKVPDIKTPLPGKQARKVVAKDRRYTSSSYIKEYPLVIARGKGAMVEDVDGNRFLDFMAGIAVNITGYSHPKVVRAVKKQAEKFFHICSTDFYYESFSNLAERLVKMCPGEGERSVFFTNSAAAARRTADHGSTPEAHGRRREERDHLCGRRSPVRHGPDGEIPGHRELRSGSGCCGPGERAGLGAAARCRRIQEKIHDLEGGDPRQHLRREPPGPVGPAPGP